MERNTLSEEYIQSKISNLKKENKISELFSFLEKHNLLKYCTRLHLRAMELPCGTREECFCGYCPNLPKDAKPIRFNFNEPFAH